jgi:DNA-binding CsgD family transcriptional regulator
VAWLGGDPEAVRDATDKTLRQAVDLRSPIRIGELAVWRARVGLDDGVAGLAAEPYASELDGNPVGAAERWAELGSTYEAALALAQTDDVDQLSRSYETLQGIGVPAAAARVGRRLREHGVRVARGPRPSTRGNPGQLTQREVEVLALVAEGLRNADIAQRLFLSEKTVGHHISAILRKLDVRTRGEAAAAGVRLGLVAAPT